MQVVDANGNVFGAGLEITGPDGKPKTTGGGGGVTTVTGTAPIVSSGGATPDISILQADYSQSGFLSTGDWNNFNNKQDALYSGTNIKTINSTSLLGAGDLAVQPTLVSGTNIKTINGSSVLGSGDLSVGTLKGVHALLKLTTGTVTSCQITAGTQNSVASIANRLSALPFNPAQTFISSNLYINVNTAIAGSLAKILIYSNVNGIPTTKLYESANLDTSTIGIKTATTSFTFTAGETYWLVVWTSANPTLVAWGVTSLIPIKTLSTSPISGYGGTATFGTAPTTFPSVINLTSTVVCVFITVA
jgi:hypothetical protein